MQQILQGGCCNWTLSAGGYVAPRIPNYTIESCFDQRCIDRDSVTSVLTGSGLRRVSSRSAIYRRARQIVDIGAEYTITTHIRTSRPRIDRLSSSHCSPFATASCDPVWVRGTPQFGMYRCDTFVISAYASTALPEHYLPMFVTEFNVFSGEELRFGSWRTAMGALVHNTTYTPRAIFSRLQGL
jgi:hypothetical protein